MRTAVITALGLAVLLDPSSAEACRKRSPAGPLDAAKVYFVGTATADSVRTGPGDVVPVAGSGHFGPGKRGSPVHGQVIRIDRLGAGAARRLPAGVREVVVVPWDYDASCRPLVWGNSALWVTPDDAGLFIADLRAPEDWVGGRPTFDVHSPRHVPYAGVLHDSKTPEAPALTPDQLFDLYDALPTREDIATDPASALLRVMRWVDAHPSLASLPPADIIASNAVTAAKRRMAAPPE